MRVLITGAKGYIGIPLCYELEKKHEVIGVDNDSRIQWVNRCGGKEDNSYVDGLVHIIKGDLTNQSFVNEIIQIHKPQCVIHLASQPSMPYSQINSERALFTQINNISMCLNLLWALKGKNIRFIITTTTGIPGQALKQIPEGDTLNKAGSWYHITRGFDSANCNLASRQWGQKVIELRTSIVYGLQTNTMLERGELTTRFDTDPYFGTVLNRFIKQAVDKFPITIYGKGKQTKPFIALEDCVRSIVNAIDYPIKDKHTIFNQVTEMISIVELAKLITDIAHTHIQHIPNPRKENETFKMEFKNRKFLKLLGKKPLKIKDVIGDMIDIVQETAIKDLSYTYPEYVR